MEIIFFIPERISTNKIYSGIHWTKRNAHKDLYQGVPFVAGKIKKFPVHVTYNFVFKSRLYDVSNLSYMVKLIEDCLVKKGVLPDDSAAYVSGITTTIKKGDDDVCYIEIN